MSGRKWGSRRGNAALVVTTLGALLGFGTLSIDLGMIWLARIELQQAIDDAALSGVGELDGTVEGIARAGVTAKAVASAHTVLGAPVDLGGTQGAVAGSGTSSVIVGRYDAKTGEFVAYATGDDPADVNAVQVIREGQQIPSGLGAAVFGKSNYSVKARSRTQRRLGAKKAQETDCFLPIAIPDCHLSGLAPDFNPAAFTFTFSPSPTDAISWALPDGNPNANDVRNQLEGQCNQGSVSIGDPVYVDEGVKATALQSIRDILNGTGAIAPTAWDTELYGAIPSQGCVGGSCSASKSDVAGASYGNVLEGPVFLVDAGDDCGSVSFTQTKPITGIAWAIIYDVKASGGTKYISVQLDVASEHLSWGTGQDDEDEDDPTNILVPSDPEMLGW